MWSGWFLIGVSVGMLIVGITWKVVSMEKEWDLLGRLQQCFSARENIVEEINRVEKQLDIPIDKHIENGCELGRLYGTLQFTKRALDNVITDYEKRLEG